MEKGPYKEESLDHSVSKGEGHVATAAPPYSTGPGMAYDDSHGSDDGDRPGFWTRMGCTPGSFKRRTLADANNQLNKTLKARHLHMIAIGGSIGAGFFVGSGSALSRGGPASLLLDFVIVGIIIFNVVYALGEMASMFPVSGGFYTYSVRFVDPSFGFAMGWNYVMQWAVVVPLELTVAGLTVEYWQVDVNVAVWITVFLVIIILLNVFGVLGYGEEEFWSSVLKLAATVIFIFIAIVLVCGGGPSNGSYNQYWGARLWYNPGAFANGFKGFCSVFVTAAFAFAGTELVGLAAAETENPQKSMPGAIKQVFWRITLFYILGLTMVGLLVAYDNPDLLGSGFSDSSASPFVIAAFQAGLIGFDSFMNVIILVSVMSIGNSGIYGGSRTLTALAEQGYAPKIFTYVDRAGRPLWSTIALLAFGCLGYMNVAASGQTVFEWLLALSGLSTLFTWFAICVSHIRFRAAWAHNGHSLSEIPFKAMFGVYGSWVGAIGIVLVFIAQFYVALFPLSGDPPNAYDFFLSYLAMPVVLVLWVIGYALKRKGPLKISQIDVNTGRKEFDWALLEKEQQEIASGGVMKRFYHFCC